MRVYLFMQMLMALAIAFQSKQHGDYKLKALPNMFYRVLGSIFRKFFGYVIDGCRRRNFGGWYYRGFHIIVSHLVKRGTLMWKPYIFNISKFWPTDMDIYIDAAGFVLQLIPDENSENPRSGFMRKRMVKI